LVLAKYKNATINWSPSIASIEGVDNTNTSTRTGSSIRGEVVKVEVWDVPAVASSSSSCSGGGNAAVMEGYQNNANTPGSHLYESSCDSLPLPSSVLHNSKGNDSARRIRMAPLPLSLPVPAPGKLL
jgi:hypothetical protein